MHIAVLLARLALTVVFGTAGSTKLLDLPASRDTVEAFGLPRAFARAGGTLLPFAELATAVALLPLASARWAAVAAIVLLIVFSGGVAVALAQGRTPDCNCFGQVSSAQISWRTLARNSAFLALAGFAAWKAPGASLTRWTTDRSAADLVAALAVTALAFAIVAALHFQRTVTSLRDSLERAGAASPAPAVGAPAPPLALPTIDGAPVTLDSLRARGLPVLLVFANPICGPCRQLLPELARWSGVLADRLTIALVESGAGDGDVVAAQVREAGDLLALVEPGFDVSTAYGVFQTPTAFLVDPDGTVARGPTAGAAAIERLVRGALKHDSTNLSEVA
jgi:uncharacterized membrane protein YphA (DoxX/SURF4 family)/thiol-disulfide isomerase/thioredoxin